MGGGGWAEDGLPCNPPQCPREEGPPFAHPRPSVTEGSGSPIPPRPQSLRAVGGNWGPHPCLCSPRVFGGLLGSLSPSLPIPNHTRVWGRGGEWGPHPCSPWLWGFLGYLSPSPLALGVWGSQVSPPLHVCGVPVSTLCPSSCGWGSPMSPPRISGSTSPSHHLQLQGPPSPTPSCLWLWGPRPPAPASIGPRPHPTSRGYQGS